MSKKIITTISALLDEFIKNSPWLKLQAGRKYRNEAGHNRIEAPILRTL